MSDSNTFQEEELTERAHMDPQKHYIGEALTPPSLDDITYAGVETKTGDSVFPARADHSHDTRLRWGRLVRTATPKVIPAGGSAYIDGLVAGVGENYLHSGSTQLIDFPQEGLWDLDLMWQISRSSGTFPSSVLYRIRFDFINATSPSIVEENGVRSGATYIRKSTRRWVPLGSVGPTTNLQILVFNFDSVDWDFYVLQFFAVRTGSSQYGEF